MAKKQDDKKQDDPQPKAPPKKAKPKAKVAAPQSNPDNHKCYRVKCDGRGSLVVWGCDESEAACEYRKQMGIDDPVTCEVELVSPE